MAVLSFWSLTIVSEREGYADGVSFRDWVFLVLRGFDRAFKSGHDVCWYILHMRFIKTDVSNGLPILGELIA